MGNLRLQNFYESPGILASLLGVILELNAWLDLYAQVLEKHYVYVKVAKSQKVFFVPSYKSAGSQQLSSFKPKGQLISKGNFGLFNSSKKQTF